LKLKGRLQNKREEINQRSLLRKIARETSIFEPKKVKQYIASSTHNASKNKYEYIYDKFCETNQLPYDKTYWKYKPPIPLIPSTENVNIIITAAKFRFYVPFAIMAETAIEGEELHRITRDQIDQQTGSLSVVGTKGHSNGTYKLSEKLAEDLRLYLARYKNDQPFPAPRYLGEAFRYHRAKRAKELNKPELLKIRLKNLRNYAGAIFYLTKGKDPIQTMFFMRHKKLETTMDYLRGIKQFATKAQYITKTVKLGQPNTIEQITELSNSGFEKYNEADGYQFFRILQY
jgi:integrase